MLGGCSINARTHFAIALSDLTWEFNWVSKSLKKMKTWYSFCPGLTPIFCNIFCHDDRFDQKLESISS